MGLLNWLRREPAAAIVPAVHAMAGESAVFYSMDDPRFLEFVRNGATGNITVERALENSAVFRCVDLISASIGMLPLYSVRVIGSGQTERDDNHYLNGVLYLRPNGWQTPFEFKQLMQLWALVFGNAYAVVVRSGDRVTQLNPIHPSRVSVTQNDDWSVVYTVTRLNGGTVTYGPQEILHLRGLSTDGICGVSRVKKAAEVISTAQQASRAANQVFRNGMMVGGNFKHPNKLSPDAYDRLKASMDERLSGPENAGKWVITEEGMEAKPFATTSRDAQLSELKADLVDDIARVFGVPRPLMGVDDTSWGSGIEQLAILFVRFGLAPWFKCWEEAIERSCVRDSERGKIKADFDETELLRGTLKDQSEFFARALGSGGHRPWMEVNEVREAVGLAPHTDGSGLIAAGETANVATQAA
jgi:HK97 family phage portal protein